MIFISAQVESKNKEKLLELAVNWNCLDGAQAIFKNDPVFHTVFFSKNFTLILILYIQNFGNHYPRLFEQALKENRPVFVDYFLRGYHNPLTTTAFVAYKNTGILLSSSIIFIWFFYSFNH